MIVIYILLGILALLALMLYLPLKIELSYDAEAGLRYKLFYAWFCLADSGREKNAAEETAEPSLPKGKKKKKKGGSSVVGTLLSFLGLKDVAGIANVRRALDEKGLCQMLSDIGRAVKDLLRTTGRLSGKARFRRFDLQIIVGDSDAGDAALRYGQVCAVLYPLLDSLKSVKRCKNRRLDLRCDFLREESVIRFDGVLQYRPRHFVGFLGGLIWNYIKRSVKGS